MIKTSDSSVDFSGLVLGFSSAALSYLGYGPDGKQGGPSNLSLAQQNINIIKLLEEKTKGNLTPPEQTLIRQVQSDLMHKYADCCNQKSK